MTFSLTASSTRSILFTATMSAPATCRLRNRWASLNSFTARNASMRQIVYMRSSPTMAVLTI